MSELQNIPDKPSVDWLLSNVDLTFKGYIPSEVAFEFFSFIRLALGEEPENTNPLAHYFLIDTIFQQDTVAFYYEARGIDYDKIKGKTAIMCCREFSKSTLIGTFLPLFMAWRGTIPGYGKVNYGLYVGDSMRNNVKTTMNTIEMVFLESEWLLDQFESYRFTDEVMELVRPPRTPKEIASVQRALASGKKKDQVPGRSKRKFALKGVGAQALSLDSKLYTDTGFTTMGDVQVGDKIYGADGVLTTVTEKSEVFHRDMYRIVLKDGRSIKASVDHIHSIVKKTSKGLRELDVTTKKLLDMPLYYERPNGHREQRLYIKNVQPVEYSEKEFQVDPYVLGLILGDGTVKKDKNHVRLTGAVDDISYYEHQIPYSTGKIQLDKRNLNVATVTILGIGEWFHKVGLAVNSYDKFIPKEYMRGSVEQRLSILQGLMDTDGTVANDNRGTRFMTTSRQLADDVTELVRSLGGTVVEGIECNAEHRVHTLYRLFIRLNMQVVRLPRKLAKMSYEQNDGMVGITSITRIEDEPSQCIAVDNEERQYITDNYFRTHNTGTRGTRSGLDRPQFVIFDDLVASDADANSETVLGSIESTIDKDVLKALHGSGSFAMIIGTPYNKKDPVYKRLESGRWVPVVFPICKEIRPDLTEEEFEGVWPDRHSYKAVMNRYRDDLDEGKLRSFNQELMLRITSEDDKMIPDKYLTWYNRSDIINRGEEYNWYITTDFTTTGAKGSDFSGIAVWAVNSNDDWLLVDLSLKKLELEDQYKELFRFVNRYKRFTGNIVVGVEIDGQQKAHIHAIQQRMAKENEYFTLGGQKGSSQVGIRSASVPGKKHDRFKMVVPRFQTGKIWFPEELRTTSDMVELLTELQYVTFMGFGSQHDDGADLITQMYMMETYSPSTVKQEEHVKDVMWWDGHEDSNDSAMNSYIV